MADNFSKLVVKAKKGNKQALTEIFEKKGRLILYVCNKITGNAQDGEDAAQEVFIKVQQKIKTLKDPATFDLWLYQIIRNTCKNFLRASSRREELSLLAGERMEVFNDLDIEFLPDQYAEDREKRKILLSAIDALPSDKREAVVLFYFTGLSHAEIAGVLDKNPKTVDYLLRSARQTLRQQIEKNSNTGLFYGAVTPISAQVIARVMQLESFDIANPAKIAKLIQASGVLVAAGAKTVIWQKIAASISAIVLTVTAGAFIWGLPGDIPAEQPPLILPISESVPTNPYQSSPQLMDASLPTDDGLEIAVPASLPQAEAGTAGSALPVGPDGGATSRRTAFINLHGEVRLEKTDRTPLPDGSIYVQQVEVLLLDKQKIPVASTHLKPDGGYLFENAEIPEAGEYHLMLQLPPDKGLELAEGQDENVAVRLGFDKKTVEAPIFHVTDNAPPSTVAYFYTKTDTQSISDPTAIEIVVSDATRTGIYWKIYKKDDEDEAVAQGSGLLIQDELEKIRANFGAGEYVLVIYAVDSAGNSSERHQEFLLTKMHTAAN